MEEAPQAVSLLEVRDLRVEVRVGERRIRAVDGIGFSIRRGQTFALLGESGCGKSMTALALMRLLPQGGQIAGGSVRLAGEDLLALPEAAMRQVRGGRMGMIFQEPSTSLNPVMSVADQLGEVLALHRGLRRQAAREAARGLLDAVGIPDAGSRLESFPFQLSGGMKQRIMIAMALAGEPGLLIADEPTTALDVTIQAQVLDILAALQAERGMGMLLITHDLGVVARMAHEVGVMYAGELVETGPRASFFREPLHPYSRKLFAALPGAGLRGHLLETLPGGVPALDRNFAGCRFADRCPERLARCDTVLPAWHGVGGQRVRCHLYADTGPGASLAQSAAQRLPERQITHEAPLLDVRALRVHFPVRKGLLRRTSGWVKAVDGVDLRLAPGRTLALVGESGCGKTTVGKAILQLQAATGGEVFFDGESLIGRSSADLKPVRQALQMVFQDPFASLNPRMHVGDILLEGMEALGVEANTAARRRKVGTLLERVGLSPAMMARYPHEFSGGQRQRIAIARALAVSPRLIVCDEPTSALDVSVQAQILNLLGELQRELGLAYLFITHNLAVVDYLAHEVAVMYLGRIVEQGPAEKLLPHPAHPYTQALLAAIPQPAVGEDDAPPQRAAAGQGELPSALNPPPGCHFHPRCPRATDVCRARYPAPSERAGGGYVRCHWPLE